MSQRGFTFRKDKAEELANELEQIKGKIARRLQRAFTARTEQMKKPAYYGVQWPDGSWDRFPTKGKAERARKDRKLKPKDVLLKRGPVKIKKHEFNPGSRDQIKERLFEKYGWTAPTLTDTGNDKLARGEKFDDLVMKYGSVDEESLKATDYPETKDLVEYLVVTKRLSQLKDGQQAWLKQVKDDGRIHHRMITIGCATTRCSHSKPNLGQVPTIEKPYGTQCRSLFVPGEGYIQVGIDLSGIEARMLAHFMSPFDGGAYIQSVLEGDIHMLNVDAIREGAGFDISRGGSKGVYYAYMYGGGNLKLGMMMYSASETCKRVWEEIREDFKSGRVPLTRKKYVGNSRVLMSPDEAAYWEIGNQTRNALETGVQGLGTLVEKVQEKAKDKGFLAPLDKRHIPVRSPHSALNTLLQGSAAIVMKQWTVRTWEEVRRRRLDAHLLAVVHDEHQSEVHPDVAEEYQEISLDQIKKTGEYYNLAIPLSGEAQTGMSWADCH